MKSGKMAGVLIPSLPELACDSPPDRPPENPDNNHFDNEPLTENLCPFADIECRFACAHEAL